MVIDINPRRDHFTLFIWIMLYEPSPKIRKQKTHTLRLFYYFNALVGGSIEVLCILLVVVPHSVQMGEIEQSI
jgi:hypothetical protein